MTFFDKIISKRKNIIISLIILTIISSITLFLIPNINSGHDLTFHLSRISAIKDNLELGIIGGIISILSIIFVILQKKHYQEK